MTLRAQLGQPVCLSQAADRYALRIASGAPTIVDACQGQGRLQQELPRLRRKLEILASRMVEA